MTWSKQLNRYLLLCCGLGLWVSAMVAHAQSPFQQKTDGPLRLEISSSRQTYTQGEAIPIRVEISNVSSHDVLIGRDMWGIGSPSRTALHVTARDGHHMNYLDSRAENLPSPVEDLSRAVLKWCMFLPPGYHYSTSISLQAFVTSSDLVPGTYNVRAQYSTSGVDAKLYFNPLLEHPEELATLKSESWSGEITSNEVKITITR